MISSKLNSKVIASGVGCGRRGFTLVELLMVISVLSILSGLALLAVRGAEEDAKIAATQTRMTQVRTVLQQRLEEYEVRKAPVNLYDYVVGGRASRLCAKVLKQKLIADFVHVEMPRSAANIESYVPALPNHFVAYPSQEFCDWIGVNPLNGNALGGVAGGPRLHDHDGAPIEVPAGSSNYIYIFGSPADREQLFADLRARPPAMMRRIYEERNSLADPTIVNSPAEFLYAAIALSDFDGEPGTALMGKAVGDGDGDGVPEVVDAWDQPVVFGIGFVPHDSGLVFPLGQAIADETISDMNMDHMTAYMISAGPNKLIDQDPSTLLDMNNDTLRDGKDAHIVANDDLGL